MKDNTIWYGTKGNETQFAREEQSLKNNGIDSPRSFHVDGDITGLKLVDEQSNQSNQSGQTATA